MDQESDSRYYMAVSGLQHQKWLSMSSLGDQLLALEEADNVPIILSHRKEVDEEENFDAVSATIVRETSPAPSDCSVSPCSSEVEALNDEAGRAGESFGSYDVSEETDGGSDKCDYAREHLLLQQQFDRDTSGYTSNNSSKDESHQGSCSVSMRSSSPESVLSGSINSDTLTPFTTHKSKEIKVFNKIPTEIESETLTTLHDSTRFLNETPIEREIRLAKDRENELRQRRGLLLVESTTNVQDADKLAKKPAKVIIPNEFLVTGNRDVQRRLATTRLQQEIEEQRRRELDLRRDGRVQSISEEHVDPPLSVSPEREVFLSSEPLPISPLPQNGLIKKQKEAFEAKLSALEGPVREEIPVKKAAISNLIKHPSETNLAKHFVKENKMSHMKVPVSMEKFFSSRGKVVSNVVTSGYQIREPISGSKEAYVDFSAVRLRSLEEAVAPKKMYRPAVNKISQELKEMQEREEELRLTRTMLGLSIINQKAEETSQSSLPSGGVKPADPLPGTNEFTDKSARRRSTLVAQWEERIQQQA